MRNKSYRSRQRGVETIEHGNTWITGTGDNMHWQLLRVTAGAASEQRIYQNYASKMI